MSRLNPPLARAAVTSEDCGRFGAPRPNCRKVVQGLAQATRKHLGIDLRAATGTPIVACADGRVVFAGYDLPGSARQNATNEFAQAHQFDGNGGIMVFVDHGGGLETRSMHLSRLDVQLGDRVVQGQQLGLSGDSGDARGGPHLHFELISGGDHVDPAPFIFQPPSPKLDGGALLALLAAGGLILGGLLYALA